MPKGGFLLKILPEILNPGHKSPLDPSGGQKIQWFKKAKRSSGLR